jgi:hypothetical protein
MTRLVIPLELLFVAFADAVSIPSTRNNNTSDSVQLGWSRQDILTLIGVCIAVVGILAAVLVSSPGLRERLCTPFECKQDPTQRSRSQYLPQYWRMQASNVATLLMQLY